MFKANWFVDFDVDKQSFHLHEIGASETGGARLEGVFQTFEEVLAKVPDAPPETPPQVPDSIETPVLLETVQAPSHSRASTILDEGVDRLDLPPGVAGKLKSHGMRTIGDLLLAAPGDLLNLRGFGLGKLQAVEDALADHGLCLRRTRPRRTETATRPSGR